MTHIVSLGLVHKKDLVDMAKAWNAAKDKHAEMGKPFEQRGVYFNDPSIFDPRDYTFASLPESTTITCTNHPKRSWFATVEKRDGKIIVK